MFSILDNFLYSHRLPLPRFVSAIAEPVYRTATNGAKRIMSPAQIDFTEVALSCIIGVCLPLPMMDDSKKRLET